MVDEAPAESKPAPAAQPTRSPRRVLVVDDNADAADLLGALLRGAGHDVAVAYDPASALGLLDRFAPSVAVLDIGLPVLDGYALAAQMRERLANDCCFIALTGYAQDRDDPARASAAGFEQYLMKPVDPDRLVAMIEERASPISH